MATEPRKPEHDPERDRRDEGPRNPLPGEPGGPSAGVKPEPVETDRDREQEQKRAETERKDHRR